MKKSDQKKLRLIASKLPKIVEGYKELGVSRKRASEIMTYDKINKADADSIRDKIESLHIEKRRIVNHYRRLKKSFKKDGINGVRAYVIKANYQLKSGKFKEIK